MMHVFLVLLLLQTTRLEAAITYVNNTVYSVSKTFTVNSGDQLFLTKITANSALVININGPDASVIISDSVIKQTLQANLYHYASLWIQDSEVRGGTEPTVYNGSMMMMYRVDAYGDSNIEVIAHKSVRVNSEIYLRDSNFTCLSGTGCEFMCSMTVDATSFISITNSRINTLKSTTGPVPNVFVKSSVWEKAILPATGGENCTSTDPTVTPAELLANCSADFCDVKYDCLSTGASKPVSATYDPTKKRCVCECTDAATNEFSCLTETVFSAIPQLEGSPWHHGKATPTSTKTYSVTATPLKTKTPMDTRTFSFSKNTQTPSVTFSGSFSQPRTVSVSVRPTRTRTESRSALVTPTGAGPSPSFSFEFTSSLQETVTISPSKTKSKRTPSITLSRSVNPPATSTFTFSASGTIVFTDTASFSAKETISNADVSLSISFPSLTQSGSVSISEADTSSTPAESISLSSSVSIGTAEQSASHLETDTDSLSFSKTRTASVSASIDLPIRVPRLLAVASSAQFGEKGKAQQQRTAMTSKNVAVTSLSQMLLGRFGGALTLDGLDPERWPGSGEIDAATYAVSKVSLSVAPGSFTTKPSQQDIIVGPSNDSSIPIATTAEPVTRDAYERLKAASNQEELKQVPMQIAIVVLELDRWSVDNVSKTVLRWNIKSCTRSCQVQLLDQTSSGSAPILSEFFVAVVLGCLEKRITVGITRTNPSKVFPQERFVSQQNANFSQTNATSAFQAVQHQLNFHATSCLMVPPNSKGVEANQTIVIPLAIVDDRAANVPAKKESVVESAAGAEAVSTAMDSAAAGAIASPAVATTATRAITFGTLIACGDEAGTVMTDVSPDTIKRKNTVVIDTESLEGFLAYQIMGEGNVPESGSNATNVVRWHATVTGGYFLLLLILSLLFCGVLSPLLRLCLRSERTSDTLPIQRERISIVEGLGHLRFPGVMLIPILLGLQAATGSTVSLWRFVLSSEEEDAGTRVLAGFMSVLGTIMLLGVPSVWLWVFLGHPFGRPVFSAIAVYDAPFAEGRSLFEMLYGGLSYLVRGPIGYKDNIKAPIVKDKGWPVGRMLRLAIGDYKGIGYLRRNKSKEGVKVTKKNQYGTNRTWFICVELLFEMCFGVIRGLGVGPWTTMAECFNVALFFAILSVLYSLTLILVRPYHSPLQQLGLSIASVASATGATLLCLFMYRMQHGDNSLETAALGEKGQAAFAIGILVGGNVGLMGLVTMVWDTVEWFYHKILSPFSDACSRGVDDEDEDEEEKRSKNSLGGKPMSSNKPASENEQIEQEVLLVPLVVARPDDGEVENRPAVAEEWVENHMHDHLDDEEDHRSSHSAQSVMGMMTPPQSLPPPPQRPMRQAQVEYLDRFFGATRQQSQRGGHHRDYQSRNTPATLQDLAALMAPVGFRSVAETVSSEGRFSQADLQQQGLLARDGRRRAPVGARSGAGQQQQLQAVASRPPVTDSMWEVL